MLFKKKQEKSVSIPTSALPDIVFLLLIFFLVTTTIDTEKGLHLVLPDFEPKPVKYITNLLINQDGEILLDNDRIELHQISSTIKEKVSANSKLVISVKSDRETNYDVYIDVLDRLRKAGARKISIAEPEDY